MRSLEQAKEGGIGEEDEARKGDIEKIVLVIGKEIRGKRTGIVAH